MKRIRTLLLSLIAACFFLVAIQFAVHPQKSLAAPPESAPISLTNPDGQALTLEKYDLRAAVHGALSLVEMEMVFRNPQPRQMEGRFIYTLPSGATVSRFAKEVNGKLMEGEVVERMRAQAIFTEILHTMRDPALLETDQGNRFSARIFPVPPSGTVRLLLSFSQTMPIKNGTRKLTIPLAGLPKIGEFTFSATGRPLSAETGSGVVLDKDEDFGESLAGFTRHAQNFEPKKDIEITFKAATNAPVRALKAGNFQMVQFLYSLPAAGNIRTPPPPNWHIYFDTSASGADIELPRLTAIDKLMLALQPVLVEGNRSFGASTFDIDVHDVFPFAPWIEPGAKPNGKSMPILVHDLRSRHALGATNLEAALKSIGEKARAQSMACTFVLASDGIPTWGAREPAELLKALGDWPAQHTLHALVLGTREDERILKAITEKGHGRIVHLALGGAELDANVRTALAELRAPLGAHFEVYDEGTAWIYPKEFYDVRPGTELVAFSEIKPGTKSKPGFVQRGTDGKVIQDIAAEAAPIEAAEFAPLLQREAYKAYLDVLDKNEQAATDATKRAEIRNKRVEVSVKNRVLCPLTSLLVLETEADYQRFKIDRTALAEVMQIGANGIEMRKRTAADIPIPVTPPTPAPMRKAEERAKAMKSKGEPGREADRAGSERFEAFEKRDQLKDLIDTREQAIEAEGLARDGEGGGNRLRMLSRSSDAPSDPAARPHPGPAGTVDYSTAAANPFRPSPESPASPPVNSPEPAAARRTGDATPRPADQSRAASSATNGVAGKAAIPDWTRSDVATDAQLAELRAVVQAKPNDRTARNAYADALFKAKKWDNLQAEVFQWLPFDPENPAVYEFLGKSATGLNDNELALRAYSSIAEIAPNRAALLSRAGFLLLAAKKYNLAESMFLEALKNRQDDANIHRGLGLSRWLSGKFEESAAAYESALMKDYNPRYGDVKRVLREEYAYVLRAWRKSVPAKADAILARAQNAHVDLFRVDALRVTMCWETDANDVDLHVVDPNGEECFYSRKTVASGLELYSDQTQGLGPEVIRTDKTLPGTYSIGVNYFAAGPMGVSRGVVVIMKPKEGVDENPEIIPFALIEGGKDMRFLGAVSY